MTPLVSEWIEKADGDLWTARRELSADEHPNYDSACFHAQQCVEKYLKARLQEAGIAFGRSHNLVALLDMVLAVEPTWDSMRVDLQILGVYAVNVRYPGTSADRESAVEAVGLCENIRLTIRESFRLGE
jgi:HEPN domain-containing protein